MRRALQRILRHLGYELRRVESNSGRDFDLLRAVVRDASTWHPGAYIVQVGANDGDRQDPIRPLLHEDGLPAVCIEPLPDLAEALRANTRGLPGVRVREHAVAAEPGVLKLYRVDPDRKECPDWAHGMVSADPAVIWHDRRLRKLGRDALVELETPAVPLDVVIQEEGIGEILLLQVDVEGFDDVVVGSALDQGLRPWLINYEHKHLSVARQQALRRRLLEHGYRLASWNGEDTLAARGDASA